MPPKEYSVALSHSLHLYQKGPLLYQSDARAVTIDIFCRFDAASSSTPIWLSGLSCSSSDTSLFQCSHATFGSNYCSHSEDIAVFCLGGEYNLHDNKSIIRSNCTPIPHHGTIILLCLSSEVSITSAPPPPIHVL